MEKGAARPVWRRTVGGVNALVACLALGLLIAGAVAANAQSIEELKQMSIEALANVPVTTVTRTNEPLSDAPAAIYVITHDEIIRSGAQTLPEMLRLAPNLEVARINNYAYAISARGFNAYAANKLLVLIDGRAVYSPYFNGIFWDVQDVPPEQIQRIEVISGPGATLWGPNAVNGVINVITYSSRETQGGLLTMGGGNRGARGELQYGGQPLPDLSYRVYGEGIDDFHNPTPTGADARDAWHREQGGFRIDWTPGADQIMVEGNLYGGLEQQQGGVADTLLYGQNLSARWTHPLSVDSSLQILSYYASDSRFASGVGDRLDTYDIELQHNWNWSSRQAIVWGIDERLWVDNFSNAPLTSAPVVLYFLPKRRTINMADVYVQDTISLNGQLKLIPGLKVEDEAPYTGLQPLPSLRLSWKPDPTNLFWAAVSRAARNPSREDRDLYGVVAGTIPFLAGNDFRPETVTAFEIGTRGQPTPQFSYSVSLYYNLYNDLRTLQMSPGGVLPDIFSNEMEGNSYGIEAWANWQVLSWWRLSPGLFWQHQNLRFKAGAPLGATDSASGDDPAQEVHLRSSMDLGGHVTFDVDLREVGDLRSPHVPGYVELNGRLGWQATPRLELSLNAENLLHNRHIEFLSSSFPVPVEIGRTVFVEARCRF